MPEKCWFLQKCICGDFIKCSNFQNDDGCNHRLDICIDIFYDKIFYSSCVKMCVCMYICMHHEICALAILIWGFLNFGGNFHQNHFFHIHKYI